MADVEGLETVQYPEKEDIPNVNINHTSDDTRVQSWLHSTVPCLLKKSEIIRCLIETLLTNLYSKVLHAG